MGRPVLPGPITHTMATSPTRSEKTAVSHYDVLAITPPSLDKLDNVSAGRLVKMAYRRALLRYHPDKAAAAASLPACDDGGTDRPASLLSSVDQIMDAYRVLSDPVSRLAYDRELAQQAQLGRADLLQNPDSQTGIEVVDLGEMACIPDGAPDGTDLYYRPCRCGNPRGYTFSESDAGIGDEEILVACHDCSLWIKVEIQVIEMPDPL